MLMYLFWIYIVLKVKQIADYDRGVTKKQLLVSVVAHKNKMNRTTSE